MGLICLFILFLVAVLTLYIVPKDYAYVITRLGKKHKISEMGIHFKIPCVDSVWRKVSLQEQVLEMKPSPIITKDNKTMQIQGTVFFKVVNPNLYIYSVDNPSVALEFAIISALRNLMGEKMASEIPTTFQIMPEYNITLSTTARQFGIDMALVDCAVV